MPVSALLAGRRSRSWNLAHHLRSLAVAVRPVSNVATLSGLYRASAAHSAVRQSIDAVLVGRSGKMEE